MLRLHKGFGKWSCSVFDRLKSHRHNVVYTSDLASTIAEFLLKKLHRHNVVYPSDWESEVAALLLL